MLEISADSLKIRRSTMQRKKITALLVLSSLVLALVSVHLPATDLGHAIAFSIGFNSLFGPSTTESNLLQAGFAIECIIAGFVLSPLGGAICTATSTL